MKYIKLYESFEDFEETWIQEEPENPILKTFDYKFIVLHGSIYIVQEYLNNENLILFKNYNYFPNLQVIYYKFVYDHSHINKLISNENLIRIYENQDWNSIYFDQLSNDIQKLIYKSYNL